MLSVLGIVLAALVESKNKTLSAASHISLQSIVTSALLFGVPLTHIITGKAAHSQYSLFQPFKGGWAFVLLQALGWTLWVLAVVSSIASLFLVSRNEYVIGVISGAGVAGVIAQGMVLLSLKYFDRPPHVGHEARGEVHEGQPQARQPARLTGGGRRRGRRRSRGEGGRWKTSAPLPAASPA